MKNVILLAGLALTTGLNIVATGYPQGTQQSALKSLWGDFEGKGGFANSARDGQEQSTKDFNR